MRLRDALVREPENLKHQQRAGCWSTRPTALRRFDSNDTYSALISARRSTQDALRTITKQRGGLIYKRFTPCAAPGYARCPAQLDSYPSTPRVPCVIVAISLAPHCRSNAAALLRLLAACLAAIVFTQGLAAAHAIGAGPLHRHRDSDAPAQHAHHHSGAERHFHDAHDTSVVPAAEEGDIDAVGLAIAAAMALMAFAYTLATPAPRRHVWRAARSWAWHTAVPSALRKPPRLA